MRAVDMTGRKAGKLTVIARAGSRKGNALWLCTCECGGRATVDGSNLRTGQTRSCGCLNLQSTADPVARIWAKYKAGADRRTLPLEISTEQFTMLLAGNCDYCGAPPSQTIRVGHGLNKPHPTFRYNGIDRVDTARGYVDGNVVSCCGACNRAKGRMSREDFLHQIEAIHGWQTRCARAAGV